MQEEITMQNEALVKALDLIAEDGVSCVVIRAGQVDEVRKERGIVPILTLYEEGALTGAFVVDKIIGKAAAMILTQGGVCGCYGVTMSRSALAWLTEHGIPCRYGLCVESIINRTGDDICPMEKTVQDIWQAPEAIEALKNTLARLREKNGK